MLNAEPAKAQQRIMTAATELFSTLGYNGVGTRRIAEVAEVNETSIYRYYHCKRDLFVAALESEFAKVRLRVDLLSKLAAATDARSAMLALFRAVLDAVLHQRALVRLVHFSVLEFGSDLEDVYRRHLRDALQGAGQYLERWPELLAIDDFDPRLTVLSFVATIVALQDFYPMLSGHQLSAAALDQVAQQCATLWYKALAADPVQTPPSYQVAGRA